MAWFRHSARRRSQEIAPDEIFLDSYNLPSYDTLHFEGRLEQPIRRQTLAVVGGFVAMLFFTFGARTWNLMFTNGVVYATQAAENQLTIELLFADRGALKDRAGVDLAYNVRAASTTVPGAGEVVRAYSAYRGVAHMVGYTKPPAKDTSGVYYQTSFVGIDGAERVFDGILSGKNGRILTETDARGDIVSQSAEESPIAGSTLKLSIDAGVTQGLYDAIAARASGSNFQAGAGVLMDIDTGELIALTSYPEYSSQTLSEGSAEALAALTEDKREPFLDRAVDGLYAPGSIVKPFIAVAALDEGVIDEHKQILSTGSISVPNPYDKARPTVFKDWRVNGWTDMRRAIAVSSDIYFYEVGGGFEGQPGLGIDRLGQWIRAFGFGEDVGFLGFSSQVGTIPSPAWKEVTFPGDPWRIGNTYHTSIGQYGMQVTPLQAVRAVAALANGGRLLTPTLVASSTPYSRSVGASSEAMQVAREGMRLGVTDGIAGAVNTPYVSVAAKTGTAQVGVKNEYMNSWMIGFFPYEHPRYAYAVVLERGPAGTAVGASAAVRAFLDWLNTNAPQYLEVVP